MRPSAADRRAASRRIGFGRRRLTFEGVDSRSCPPKESTIPAFEEYCECIFELGEDDVEIIQARIAERLQISRPAVSEMMKRLEAEGLIMSDDGIQLTADRASSSASGSFAAIASPSASSPTS